MAINGINNVATRPDLLDRSLLIELERIPFVKRAIQQSGADVFIDKLPIQLIRT